MKRCFTLYALVIASFSSFVSADPSGLDDVDAGVSPVQLNIPKMDLPSSVTVITREQIRLLGITEITDALRLVPGMAITQSATTKISVGYHGTNRSVPRRMDVLIDGSTIRRVGNETVYWNAFPVSIDDIERIEVTRNPDNPNYGAHSFQATVNFITRHPADVVKNEVVFSADSHDIERQSALVHGDFITTNFYLRFENSDDAGFDIFKKVTPKGIENALSLDGQGDKKVFFRSASQLTDKLSLDISSGWKDATMETPSSDTNTIGLNNQGFTRKDATISLTFNQSDSNSWFAKLRDNEFSFRKNWDTCYPTPLFTDEVRALYNANPSYLDALLAGKKPSGGTAQDTALYLAAATKIKSMGANAKTKQCGNINEDYDEGRRSFSIENRHIFNEKLEATSGIEVGSNYFNSQTFLGGKKEVQLTSIYSSLQYKPTDAWTFNFGENYTHDNLNDDSHFAPHMGVSYHFDSSQTLKLVYSTSFRDPALLERDVHWTYYMKDFTNPLDGKTGGYFYKTTTNPFGDSLVSEKMTSYEVSLSGPVFNSRLTYDLRIFHEDFSDLITQDFNFNKFVLSNTGETKLKGAELEAHYAISNYLKASLGYAGINNDSNDVNEITLYTPRSGFMVLAYNDQTNFGSLAYYSEKSIQWSSFDRVELVYGRNLGKGKLDLYWQAKVRYQPSDFVATLGNINATGTDRDGAQAWYSYQDKVSYMLKTGIHF